MKDSKGKHLTLDNRIEIQLGLKNGQSLNEIAFNIGKDPRTVSFEIKRHLIKKVNDKYLWTKSPKDVCLKHQTYPFVCDACSKKKSCTADIVSYEAKTADAIYKKTLSHSRTGANLNLDGLVLLNDVIKKGTDLGQSLEHIHASNTLPCSPRSSYRHIEHSLLDTKSFNLRMKPRLRPRKKKKTINNDFSYLNGRLMMNYLEFISKNPGLYTTQIDTVEGTKSDSKVILTIVIIELHFFYAFVLEKQNSECVLTAFKTLHQMVGTSTFNKLFPVFLTDRGSEFKSLDFTKVNPHLTSKLFFCDPLASYQKGSIEKYHTLLRYIFPKGKSLDFLTQDKLIQAICSLNNYRLNSNNFIPAFDMFNTVFGSEVLDKLKVRKLDPDSIHLTPLLVK